MARLWLMALVFLVLSGPSRAEAQRYASIIVDADSLEIIHARQIDEERFPASLTKVMTLYLTFDALNDGRLRLDDRLTVSPNAARTPPVSIGLRAGDTLTVRDAIQALSVKSANDAAVVLAEKIAGSEAAFAAQMTAKAHELGMQRTRFMTASGLPHPEQKSSARDMAKLASAILSNHRRYYHYFGQTEFNWRGRNYKTTNRLLNTYEGVDGFKTGYTRDSGYNLIISAQRKSQRLIAVVMGGASGKSRDQHMKNLIERGFHVMGTQPQAAPVKIVEAVPDAGLTPPGQHPTEIVNLRGPENVLVSVRSGQSPIKLASSTDKAVWAVQLGVFKQHGAAANLLAATGQKLDLNSAPGQAQILPARMGGETYHKARITRLTHNQALELCKALEKQTAECLIVSGQ